MSKKIRIFGPPGTGKTTTLLEIVEKSLSRGVKPEEIAYLSFSKKAADEAVSRACKKFGLDRQRFIYFRTLHSLGYYVQGLRIDDGMKHSDYKQIATMLGMDLADFEDDETSYGSQDGDNCMQIHRLARSKMIDPQEEWRIAEKQVTIGWSVVEQWIKTVERYKESNQKHDFEDMLEKFSGALPVRVFIVDEAQDLSKLQWWVVEQACRNAEEIYYAGDDDQSIYNWNGADVDHFMNLEVDESITLPTSWRVPEDIYHFSNSLTARISKRIDKEWHPANKGGKIERDCKIWDLPVENGEWFILSRNAKFLASAKMMLWDKGYLFNDNTRKQKRSITPEDARLITNWEKLRSGGSITMAHANELINKINNKLPTTTKQEVFMSDMPMVEGFKKKPWYEALERCLLTKRIDYIRSCLRNGQKLNEEPRITISTIHKVKGGEAENVAIISDYSYLSSQFLDEDDEHRIQYVAATRAKSNLYIISPETEYFYDY